MVHIFKRRPHIFKCMVHIFKWVMHIFKWVMHIYKSMVHIFKWVMHIYAKSRIYMHEKLMWFFLPHRQFWNHIRLAYICKIAMDEADLNINLQEHDISSRDLEVLLAPHAVSNHVFAEKCDIKNASAQWSNHVCRAKHYVVESRRRGILIRCDCEWKRLRAKSLIIKRQSTYHVLR